MRTHLSSPGEVVFAEIRTLREHGFIDLPLPCLVYTCAAGRVLYRRHETVTDVVLVRAHDAVVAMRFHSPTEWFDGHQPTVIWSWRGHVTAVVDELLDEFYRHTEPPTVSNIAPAVMAWLAEP